MELQVLSIATLVVTVYGLTTMQKATNYRRITVWLLHMNKTILRLDTCPCAHGMNLFG